MEQSPLLYEVADGIATITLNRPEAMNTFSFALMTAFVDALDKTDADDDVRAVIITGAGERAFCAGADLSQGSATFDYKKQGSVRDRLKVGDIYRDGGGWMTLRMLQSLKPLIGAINGSAAGIGASLQAAMDFRFASNKAKTVFPFVRRGIVPDAACSWFLPRVVGMQTALDWCLTGRQIAPEEALEKGFFKSLHEPGEVMATARAFAREIVDNASPVSVALTRTLMWRLAGADHPMAAHQAESRGVSMRGPSADVKEGISSFIEKRKPNFPGRVSTDMPDIFPFWEEPEFR
jgi:enoyl-CoA hydratase/carnithine racemase